MRHRWSRFLALAFFPCVVACIDDFDHVGDGQFGSGDSCASICDEAARCEGAQSASACAEQCEELERIVERADCVDVFRDFMDCASEIPDICQISEDQCRAEIEAYTDCIFDYCNAYPDDCDALSE